MLKMVLVTTRDRARLKPILQRYAPDKVQRRMLAMGSFSVIR